MRRVVITGMGIVSCLGNDPDEVLTSLRTGKSGITFNETYRDLGFRSHISGTPNIDLGALIDRKSKRFMGDAAAYTYVSMQQAIEDAGLSENEVSHERTGLIVGSGGASSQNVVEGADTLRAKGIKRVGPYLVTRCMSSTVSACLATPFKIRGVNYSITSACATSVHCIGNAVELIQWGKQDLVFAGGGDEEHWSLSLMFDGMGALSSKYNDTPERASRPFDVDRDGFVIAGGGGVLVLEEYEHAKARGAKIYAEVVGYGATSDGANMVAPSGEGAVRCMRQSLADVKEPVQYINAHGTSTPMGDITELDALREVFADQATAPKVTSTKSLSGHSLGAAGVHEAIYSLLMLKEDFISPSVNIENRDPGAEGVDIPQATVENAGLHTVVSNSFGFGGTNGTLVFQKI